MHVRQLLRNTVENLRAFLNAIPIGKPPAMTSMREEQPSPDGLPLFPEAQPDPTVTENQALPAPGEPDVPDSAAASGEEPALEGEAPPEATQEMPSPDEAPAPPAMALQLNGHAVGLVEVLESLLFVADGPVDPAQLARVLGQPRAAVEEGLATLARQYREGGRGLRLQEYKGKYQLVTMAEAAPYVEAFLNVENSSRLSGPALETLAVIAYRQPVTRAQIEAVRGVDCAGVLRSLMQRGLIAEVGRLEMPGRPILYGVTEFFLQHFGLTDLAELPPLEQEEADLLTTATALAEQLEAAPD